MRKKLLASALLLLAACQPSADSPPPGTPTISPEATAPVADVDAADVEAAIHDRAAGVFARMPLRTALPDGVKLPIAYHRLFENRVDTMKSREYRALVETFAPVDEIETALDAEFTGRGFTIKEKAEGNQSRTLVYERTYGPVVTIRLSALAPGARSKAPRATGTLHLTWLTAK